MAASPPRAALMPASSSQLNGSSTVTSLSRKRKCSQQTISNTSITTFTVKAVSPKQTPQAATLAIITTLHRTHLPLSWLNPIASASQLPAGYLFKSPTPLLQETQHSVFIVRLQPNGCLYVVETVGENIYTAWPLLSWVSEELCHNAGHGNVAIPQLEQLLFGHGGHSRTASISSETPPVLPNPLSPKRAKNRRGAMARMSILTPKDCCDTVTLEYVPNSASLMLESPLEFQSEPQLMDSGFKTRVNATTQDAEPADSAASLDRASVDDSTHRFQREPANTLPTSTPIALALPPQLDATLVHKQYLETLYLSKTSLAFWAKGPLSRARAQVRKAENESGIAELKDWYLTMVLPTKKLDVKYKESVSNAIKSRSHSQQGADASNPSKKKTTKKFKLGKDCLYSDEDALIDKWWTSQDLKPAVAGDVADSYLRKAISNLRNRETEMQMLLILEVLHLENLLLKAKENAPVSPRPEIRSESLEGGLTSVPAKAGRARKKRDLSSELETTAERLSIWHTVGLEDALSSPEKVREGGDVSSAKSKDKLGDFCRDVIIPFYSARLPDDTKSICRKLGGPNLSPQRPRTNSSSNTMRPPPSTTTKSKPRPTPRRPLERVLSEDQTARHGSPPTLSRSSTAPQLPRLKRESSEGEMRPISRSGMQKSVSFSNREIDLVTDAKIHDTKRRKLDKLATQKKELEEAIDALKKPNRTNAARSIMDEIERRTREAQGAGKSSNNVHIMATPRRAGSRSTLPHAVGTQEASQIPSLNIPDPDPVILSSTFKPGFAIPTSSKKKRAVLSAIHDTPSRGLSKLSNPLGTIEATPATSHFRPELPLDTPLGKRLTTKSGKSVLFTPVKRKDISDTDKMMFRDVPEIPEKAGKAMDRVMGGKGVEEGFSLNLDYFFSAETSRNTKDPDCTDTSKPFYGTSQKGEVSSTSLVTKETSIYAQLGWDDDEDI